MRRIRTSHDAARGDVLSMRENGSYKPDCLLEKDVALLARRLRRSADVQMAQVAQRRLVFFAHATREVRIV